MKLGDLFDDRQGFHSEKDIRDRVAESSVYNKDSESIDDAQAMEIFRTSRQRTWLVATNERLYCLLDDARSGQLTLTWTMPKEQLVESGQVNLKLSVNRDFKPNSGLVDFGSSHRNWLYSKQLFEGQDPTSAISSLIEKKMKDH